MSALTHLRPTREAAGLTQAALATRAGISRQALGAIEAGRVDPALSVVLALARALGTTVDALLGASTDESLEVDTDVALGDRVILTRVAERWVAHPIEAEDQVPADGQVVDLTPRPRVELWDGPADQLVVPGCAPLIGLLAQRLNARGGPRRARFTWLHRTTRAALTGLARGEVAVAGVHGPRPARDTLTRVPVFSWSSGLLVQPGNPLGLRRIDDLTRAGLRLAVREVGAETRALFERLLPRGAESLLVEARVGRSHLAVARLVELGLADVGFGPRAAAVALGLGFVELAHEPFDLILAAGAVDDPRVATLLELARGRAFRREALALGYELPAAGEG